MNDMKKCLFIFTFLLLQFHAEAIKVFPYYRDLIGVIFLVLSMVELYRGRTIRSVQTKPFLGQYLMFVVGLLLLTPLDSNRRLYGSDISISTASEFVGEEWVALYVLRNAVLYVPMLIYYHINTEALTKSFLKKSLLAYILLLPVSTYLYTLDAFNGNLTFDRLLAQGQLLIPYNTFVPGLGLGAAISCSLIFDRSSRLVRLGAASVLLSIVAYSFISSSRQSLLFIAVAVLLAAFMRKSIKTYVLSILIGTVSALGIIYVAQDLPLNAEVLRKLVFFEDDITSSSRIEKLSYGISLMRPHEFVLGAGLSSVPDGGPHNDYVRWFQRAGLIGLLGFFPFVIGLKQAIRERAGRFDAAQFLICSSYLFTLYTSLFGYPRDDAFQSPFVFLGPVLQVAVVGRKTNAES